MSQLGKIADSVDRYNRFVAAEVARAVSAEGPATVVSTGARDCTRP